MLKKKKLIIGIIAAVIVVIVIASGAGNTEVDADTVKIGMLRETIDLRGKVELDTKETVYSKISGIVKNISTAEGSRVNKGFKLAQLDVKDFDIQLSKAYAAYNGAKAELKNLKESIKTEEIKQAQAQLEQAKSALKSAQKDYDNKKDKLDKTEILYKNGAVSKQEFEDVKLLVSAAEDTRVNARQGVGIAQYNLDILKKGVSQSAIEAVQANVEQARLLVEELENNKGKALVYSGIKGTVIKKYIEEGMAVQPGTPLFDIGEYDSAYVRIDVLADDAGKIKIGQKAVISGDVLDDKEIAGEVYYIAPQAETNISSLGVEQQRIEMRIRYEDGSLKLKPGYGVDVDIITVEKETALYVPDNSIFDMNEKDNVFVVKNGKLELREVRTGIESEDYIEVVQGLSEGEIIVVDPENDLKPGMKVKTVKQ